MAGALRDRRSAPRTLVRETLDAAPRDEELDTRFRSIRSEVLEAAPFLRIGDYRRFGPRTLDLLFAAYDRNCFDDRLRSTILTAGGRIDFRVSNRMTHAGGKTTLFREEGVPPRYEIAVSALLLVETFDASSRPVTVVGRPCVDRLEALQRIFEHELVHLLEFLAWETSSCRRARFATIARRLFGHRETTHQLVTPREAAAARFGIRVGDRVRFTYGGRTYTGRVNRITRRATVLVESERGVRYSNGRRYEKFYVPLSQLTRHE